MTSRSLPSTPLVSIILFCRNGAPTIRRALESVLNNTYRKIQFVVQDGQSTDGTLEILRSYGDRIALATEVDATPSDGFRKALKRCQGDIIGCCLADEELLPNAIDDAVNYFKNNREFGAVIGKTIVTDALGGSKNRSVGAKFDLLDYLMGRQTPYFCASFFLRRALEDVGFFSDDIVYDCFEFELWSRLGTQHRIGYRPREWARYTTHATQLSNTPGAIMRHIDARTAVIHRLFSNEGFFGEDKLLRDRCILGQYRMFYAHAITYRLNDVIAALEPRIDALANSVGDVEFARAWTAEQRARHVWLRFGNAFPPRTKRWILNQGFHRLVRPLFLLLARIAQGTSSGGLRDASADARDAELAMRDRTAALYRSRGQIEEALEEWRRAESLGDATIDSCACQAAQCAAYLSISEIREIQQRWVERHANQPWVEPRTLLRGTTDRGPITVGYDCAWWDSVLARHQLLNFIRRHDRSRVRPYCYSPVPVPHDIAQYFDRVRVTDGLSDEEFVAQARADELDVFVETTGFSPHHRYAAMARRCAPVQISYLNHHATSAVPNVDYILGDAILANGDDKPYFTEKIYALPGCFFCFDFREENIAYATEPPSRKRAYVTFGCFGAGSKLNLSLIELWAAVLNAVPDSRLFLRNRDLNHGNNRHFILRRFAQFGISPDRLLLMGGTDHRSILENYAEVDITLDTWPYCGGNTIAESFWQGVPVVTLLGNRFSARYGASLVRAHGCAELVADSREHYVEIAAGLANDRDRLADYRLRLRDIISRAGFNDSAQFARNIETAYAEMLRPLM